MQCQRLASFQIGVLKKGAEDHVYTCKDHLYDLAAGILLVADRYEGRIKLVPAVNEEPCEFGVE